MSRTKGSSADDVIPNGPAGVQRGSSGGPARELDGTIWGAIQGQFRANAAVMQRSSNRPASEPPRLFIEGSGCCERAPT
jgi:hypothetical protein